jgi:hypothetical protein
LKRAQALGDMDTLAAHERRVVRIHVNGDQTMAPAVLTELFGNAFS